MKKCINPLVLLLALSLCSGLGCAGSDPVEPTVLPPDEPEPGGTTGAEQPPVPTPPTGPDWTPAQSDPYQGVIHPGVPVEVAPSEDSEAFIRPRRRLDIEQLDRAIQQVTGGIAWTDGEGAEATNLFESLESTLGVPDYLRTVQEDLDPGAVFQKFLGDAARSVCTRLVASEQEAPAEERVLIAHVEPEDTVVSAPESVDQNLRYLILRYHGRHVALTDPSLQRWRWLFDKTSEVSEDPMQGWRAVCIGLITHPHFYSY